MGKGKKKHQGKGKHAHQGEDKGEGELGIAATPAGGPRPALTRKAYERELRRWRQAPGAVAEIGPASRATLETAMREFQAAVRGNAERLLQSRRAVEDLVRVIGDSLHGGPAPRAYAGGTQPAADTGAGRVIPLAFDRRC